MQHVCTTMHQSHQIADTNK